MLLLIFILSYNGENTDELRMHDAKIEQNSAVFH